MVEGKRIYYGGYYKTFSKDDIREIHEASLKVLEEVGFEIGYAPALDLLEEKGARVDRDKKRVYLNRQLISHCIKQAPSEFTFYGREREMDIVLGGTRVHFGTGGTALNVLDLERKKRKSSARDIADIASLVEKLEYLDFFIIPVYPHDAPQDKVDINRFFPAFCHTSKPVMGGVYSLDGLREVVEIAAEIAGGMDKLRQEPFLGFITSIASPLKIDDRYIQMMMEVAAMGLPLATSTAPTGGATAPITLAGTLVQQNAEALMGVVISQLVNPGTPVLYSAVPSVMDLKTMAFLMGSVESGLMNAAVSQMAYYYRIPSYITVGTSDSKVPDAQASYESATSCLLAALAGGNFIHEAAGLLEGAMTASYAQYIIDNDIIGACLRALRGVEINKDTLATEVIASVGPGGSFIKESHTMKYMRTEVFFPKVSDRGSYQAWQKAGSKDSWDRADEIAQKLLREDHRHFISEKDEKRIREKYEGLLDF